MKLGNATVLLYRHALADGCQRFNVNIAHDDSVRRAFLLGTIVAVNTSCVHHYRAPRVNH